MRDIKFRAWDKRNNKWINEELIVFADGNFGLIDPLCWDGGVTTHEDYVSEKGLAVMQYTGLKDCHGVDIYEGDIILQYPGFGYEFKTRKGIVEYADCCFWHHIKGCSLVLTDHDCRLEVIGNIYQNPELV